MKEIYLDNNATTKVDEKVLEAMLPFFKENYGNPSSMYSLAQAPHKAIEDARKVIADFVGAKSSKEIYFTSCASESANMAIKGLLEENKNKKHLITTKVEHPCVLNLHKELEKKGYKVTYIDVDSNGDLDINSLKNAIKEDTLLVSVMTANNETGVIYPVENIAKMVKEINPQTKFFTDAVQAAGKIKIDVSKAPIDFLIISGHKFHAPKGIGALYVKSGTIISPLIIGGHQERGKRAGTENVPYIVGMAKAAQIAEENLKLEETKVKYLRDKLEQGILKNVFNAKLNSTSANRVVNTTNIGFQYVEGELILLHLSDLGIFASSGSACTSGSLDASHVLKAMGVPFTSLHGSIRFSLSKYNTEEEIDYVIEKMPEVIEKLTRISPFQDEIEKLRASHKA
ncbi:MAG: cysteine desulfurase NifS [Cyanobacteria bacterium SIG30]|nr:cysteine desulfurase NifS [Cyanobacteria bacterium SIG30]